MKPGECLELGIVRASRELNHKLGRSPELVRKRNSIGREKKCTEPVSGRVDISSRCWTIGSGGFAIHRHFRSLSLVASLHFRWLWPWRKAAHRMQL